LWATQQVRSTYSGIKSGDLVGHATGRPRYQVRLRQVAFRAMQQFRIFVIKNITNATMESD